MADFIKRNYEREIKVRQLKIEKNKKDSQSMDILKE